MDHIRAATIARALAPVRAFAIERKDNGLFIHYRNNRAYFVREAHFWPFAFKLADLNNEGGHLAEIEAKLAA